MGDVVSHNPWRSDGGCFVGFVVAGLGEGLSDRMTAVARQRQQGCSLLIRYRGQNEGRRDGDATD